MQIDLDQPLQFYFGNQAILYIDNELHIAAYNHSATINNRQPYNSAQSYVRYNFNTRAVNTLFMGWSGSPSQSNPDNHNEPILIKDRDGYIHFISGAHGHNIWHRKSLLPATNNVWKNSGNQWDSSITAADKFSPGPEMPVNRYAADDTPQSGVNYIGNISNEITYPHARIDQQNIIHLVAREESPKFPETGENKRRLFYIKGIPEGSGSYRWEEKGNLILPSWASYSNYKQKVNIDRSGAIYVTYMYEIQNFNTNTWFNTQTLNRFNDQSSCAIETNQQDCLNVFNEHNRKWPDEQLTQPAGEGWGFAQDFTHAPVLIGSYDGGDTWKIITTNDFLSRVQEFDINNVVGY